MKSDWERKNEPLLDKDKEALPPLPAPPVDAALIDFEVAAGSGLRYAIDGSSLSVDDKGIVRYVLVARSASGTRNVAFEAMRCKSGEYRVYARQRADGTWGGEPGAWRPIAEVRVPYLRVLQREYFCPQSTPIADAEEGRQALRQGGHPWAKGFSGDGGRLGR